MIAKIGHGANIIGVLSYNLQKVYQHNGSILLTQKIRENRDGTYSMGQLVSSFEPYLIASKRTEKPVVHISLNPNPLNTISDALYCRIAADYMEHMGYSEQPYVVFKHMDTERPHIHIVSSCVAINGKKISDSFERRRSMKVCRHLEERYGLIPATEKELTTNDRLFKPVEYRKENIKGQIAAVVRHLPKYYQFQSLGGYNALLSLFNIKAEPVSGEAFGKTRNGLLYFAIEGKDKVSPPFKSSLFGKHAGMDHLLLSFEQHKNSLKDHSCKEELKGLIRSYRTTVNSPEAFSEGLVTHGINTVIYRSEQGRIYGISFIDHTSKTVWNGSQLGKEFSANVFHELWSTAVEKHKPDTTEIGMKAEVYNIEQRSEPMIGDQIGDFFNLLGGLLPEVHGEDYEELAFENRLKKKRKRRKGKQ